MTPCARCGRPARYAFHGAAGRGVELCRRHALTYPAVRDRALRVALLVGVILFAINQLDVVVRGEATLTTYAKIALTFIVPYSVSTYTALQVNRLG